MASVSIGTLRSGLRPSAAARVARRIFFAEDAVRLGRDWQGVVGVERIASVEEISNVVTVPRPVRSLGPFTSDLVRPLLAELISPSAPLRARLLRRGGWLRGPIAAAVGNRQSPPSSCRQRADGALPVVLDVGDPDAAHGPVALARASGRAALEPVGRALPRAVVDGGLSLAAVRRRGPRPDPLRGRG